MNNADFWASIRSIIAEGFTPEGLHKLDYYAEQFISGRLVYQRFSPREQYGCSASGETNVIASLLAGAEDCSDSDVAETLSELQRMRYDSMQKKSRVACLIQFFFVPLPLISHRSQMAICSYFVMRWKRYDTQNNNNNISPVIGAGWCKWAEPGRAGLFW